MHADQCAGTGELRITRGECQKASGSANGSRANGRWNFPDLDDSGNLCALAKSAACRIQLHALDVFARGSYLFDYLDEGIGIAQFDPTEDLDHGSVFAREGSYGR
jgi:hypothetical protein